MDRFTALLDANVIYPAALRDVLLRLADRNLYRPKWTSAIHNEWIRNVITDRPDLKPARLMYVRDTMDRHFPDALVTGHEKLIEGLELPDPDDRHIVAAAIRGRADVIITQNLKDFPAERLARYELEAQHPDEFTISLFNLYPGAVIASVAEHRAALNKPPRSAADHIWALERLGLVQLASALEEYVDVI